MSSEMIRIYNPLALALQVHHLAPASRMDSLRGKSIGILYNQKPGGDVLLTRLEQRLAETYGLNTTAWVTKHPGERVTEAMLKELRDKSDFVLNGIGD